MNKYIGLVKWFHDQSKNANYGFIEHHSLGDIFFHENGINKIEDLQKIQENVIVIFSTKESSKDNSKIEAHNVLLLSNTTDQLLLFKIYIALLEEPDSNQLIKIKDELYSKIKSLSVVDTAEYQKEMYMMFENYSYKIINTDCTIKHVNNVIRICKEMFPLNYESLLIKIESKVNTEVAHELWLNNFTKTCQIEFIVKNIFTETITTQRKILNRCSVENLDEILSLLLSASFSEGKISLEKIRSVLKLLNLRNSNSVDRYDYNNIIDRCTTYQKIESRINNMSRRGKVYTGNPIGHLDTAEIFCTKCGGRMSNNVINVEEFNNVLNWFINNRSSSPYISKNGNNKDNKKWFMFTKHDQSKEEYWSKLQYYLSLGFNIPNINEKDKFSQLISEPYGFEEKSSDLLKCGSCNHILDLSSDRERSSTIKKFHKIRYPDENKL